MRLARLTSLPLPVVLLASACSSSPAGTPAPVCDDCDEVGTLAVMNLEAALDTPEQYFDFPSPSDLRLDAEGHPQVGGFPNPVSVVIIDGLRDNAAEAVGFPMIPVAHLRFTAALAPRAPTDVIAASVDQPVFLVDVDPDSPHRGSLSPLVAETLTPDHYTPEHVLALAPRPGIVLRPRTTYAFVVRRALGDAAGAELGRPALLSRLARHAPRGEGETRADPIYAPLWETLETLAVEASEVAAATVFTTGDVAAEAEALTDGLRARHAPEITGLTVEPDVDAPELCILAGAIELPQFQSGDKPFNTDGRFVMGSDGLPVQQRSESAPVKVVLPAGPMPPDGYPLVLNIHGSGGYSIAMVRPVGDAGVPGAALGPAFPYAHRGFAVAGMAMPMNPERYPGAGETAYLNANNLAALRDTFRQGVAELRIFLDALLRLRIAPSAVASCSGVVVPTGGEQLRFDPAKLIVTGQSMGGMYTNLLGAIEPRFLAAVPTGAGGHWTTFILDTPLFNGTLPGLLGIILDTDAPLSFLHPVFALGAAGLEASDPIVAAPRLGRRPLPGHPARAIYETSAPEDSYFSTRTYDAMALAYGHQQAGEVLWPTLQPALALEGKDGIIPYPVQENLTSENGSPYTGVIVSYAPRAAPGDTFADGHAIYSRRDDVKYQYGCFAASVAAGGPARVPAPVEDFTAACE